MELSKHLRSFARTIPGKQQLLINAYAKVSGLLLFPRMIIHIQFFLFSLTSFIILHSHPYSYLSPVIYRPLR